MNLTALRDNRHKKHIFVTLFEKRRKDVQACAVMKLEALHRKGVKAYIEYRSFFPFVGIGSPHSLPPLRVCLPPHLGPRGGATLACGVGGVGEPNSYEVTTLWYLHKAKKQSVIEFLLRFSSSNCNLCAKVLAIFKLFINFAELHTLSHARRHFLLLDGCHWPSV
jgi:hypothetical protein